MQLDAGGIACGYTIDRALEELEENRHHQRNDRCQRRHRLQQCPAEQRPAGASESPRSIPLLRRADFYGSPTPRLQLPAMLINMSPSLAKIILHIIDPKTGLDFAVRVARASLPRIASRPMHSPPRYAYLGRSEAELLKKYPGSEAVIILAKEKPAAEKNPARARK